MKIGYLLTTLLLLFQITGFTQPELSLKAGITHFWSTPNAYYIRSIFLGGHNGIDLKMPVVINIAVSVGYEQHGNVSSSEFWYTKSNPGTDELPLPDQRIEKYHSFPFLIYYQMNRLEIFAGYELKFVRIGTTSEQPGLQAYSWTEHAPVVGLEYRFLNRFSLNGKLYFGGLNAPSMGPNRIISRISSGITLKYYLTSNREK